MQPLFQISHDTFGKSRIPWIQKIIQGLEDWSCPECERHGRFPHGYLVCQLEKSGKLKQVDIIGCGAHPLFVVSENFLAMLSRVGIDNVNTILGGKIVFENFEASQDYFWVDGKKIASGTLDFDKSGFVEPRICKGCNTLVYEVIKSFPIKHKLLKKYTLTQYDNQKFFTAQYLENVFFCTQSLMSSIQSNKLTNFRFEEVEFSGSVAATLR